MATATATYQIRFLHRSWQLMMPCLCYITMCIHGVCSVCVCVYLLFSFNNSIKKLKDTQPTQDFLQSENKHTQTNCKMWCMLRHTQSLYRCLSVQTVNTVQHNYRCSINSIHTFLFFSAIRWKQISKSQPGHLGDFLNYFFWFWSVIQSIKNMSLFSICLLVSGMGGSIYRHARARIHMRHSHLSPQVQFAEMEALWRWTP